MEQIRVSDLASEFELKHSVVISELKKIGVWVPTPETPLDTDIANRIRRRLQLMVELEQEEQQKKAEKTKEKKKPTPRKARARRTIKELGRPRKADRKVEDEPVESPLAGPLKPRKGQKARYRRVEIPEEPLEPEKVEVTIEDEPIIEKVEAEVSAEILEKALQQPAIDLEKAAEAARREMLKPAAVSPQAAEASRALEPPPTPAEEIESAPAAEAPDEEIPVAETVEASAEPAASPTAPSEPGIREILLTETVTVKELCEKLEIKSKDLIKDLLQRGVMANLNQVLDQGLIEDICAHHNAVPNFVSFEESVIQEQQFEEAPEDLVPRAPIVTVMGHVDHGKTSLLDSIRKSRVAEAEAGGITQHIGAYSVKVKDRHIAFLDTPGHEAFTRMRARGARVTDIVILVVAADDGVMPQTLEAINHARAAQVPILVAINKIDKPGTDLQRVKQQLSELELVPEDWGGDTVMVEVSATEKTNLDLLLEMTLLVADLQKLEANPKRLASGVVLEARLDKGRGAVGTVLIQNGTLRIGDSFVAGMASGKVRAMFDDRGKPIIEAAPSSAVELLGLQGIAHAGDAFQAVEDPIKARQIIEHRKEQLQEEEAGSARLTLDELYAQMEAGEVRELPLVLKADVHGSLEALEDVLEQLSTDRVKIKVVHRGVGAVTESDVLLASASNAIVVGFNIRPERNALDAAEHENVEMRLYSVIYEVAKDIQEAMLGLLEPTIAEKDTGRAEVRDIFRVPKFGTIAGCYIQDGSIARNAEIRLVRDGTVVHQGRIDSLRRFKEDVNSVRSGYECGISIANFNDVKVGDVIEAFVKEKVAPQLT